MNRTVVLPGNDVKVGAHPSLPDREGFGGANESWTGRADRLRDLPGRPALARVLRRHGMDLHTSSARSLYGMPRATAGGQRVADAAEVFVCADGHVGTVHEQSGPRDAGFIAEYYRDLDYRDDGSLSITREHAAFDRPRRRWGASARSPMGVATR